MIVARGPVLWALALCCGACTSGDGGPPSIIGELGQGEFEYHCIDYDLDAACSDGSSFPRAVALGSRIALGYVPETQTTDVQVTSPTELAVEESDARFPHVFDVVAPGRVVFLAVDEEQLLDLLHLDVFEPEMDVEWLDAGGELSLFVGESRELRATPYSPNYGEVLGGVYPYAWSHTNSTPIRLEAPLDQRTVTVTALAPGQSRVEIGNGSIVVTVVDGAAGSSEAAR